MIRKKHIIYCSITVLFLIILDAPPTVAAGKEKKPNLVLITIDTLRADHLHTYGYERKTSPNLDRLAAKGVLFENAYTASTRTTQSVAAMITGRYPQTIGVRSLHEKLKANEVTLAEVLKQHGYHTGGIFSNPIVAEAQIDQGFDFFFIPYKMPSPLAVKFNKILFSLLRRKRGRPVFIWIHYSDPHMPYSPPRKYNNLFNPGYWGEFRKKFSFYGNPDARKRERHELYKPKVVYNHTHIPQRDLKQIRALYDGEIVYTDKAIGELLEELRARGIMDNTLLVISADHGESLGEHQYFFEHGDFVYESTAKVPLIFHWPGKIPSGRKISQNVRTIDILPTILSLLGVADTFDKREGKDLAPAILEREQAVDLPVYIESGECKLIQYNSKRHISGVKGKIRGLIEGDWKLILTPTKSKPVLELYNLQTDPLETVNLAAKEPERAQQMAQKLQKWIKKGENQVIPPVDKKAKERLRALGYLQ